MNEEKWRRILEFPDYQISNKGRVYNDRTGRVMKTSLTQQGHVKISLLGPVAVIDDDGKVVYEMQRRTLSVAQMVAEAFVDRPNAYCDAVIILDGNSENLVAENLAWRSISFAWSYTHQLKSRQPVYYHNLAVRNLSTGREYSSIVEAGMTEGLLFDDIWRSTYRKESIYPYGFVFEVFERV